MFLKRFCGSKTFKLKTIHLLNGILLKNCYPGDFIFYFDDVPTDNTILLGIKKDKIKVNKEGVEDGRYKF